MKTVLTDPQTTFEIVTRAAGRVAHVVLAHAGRRYRQVRRRHRSRQAERPEGRLRTLARRYAKATNGSSTQDATGAAG
jgi:hypothetical protein